MRTTELATRFGVSPDLIRYYFFKWCHKNGRNPREFKVMVEYQHGSQKRAMEVYDIPEEAVDYISEQVKKRQEKRKKEIDLSNKQIEGVGRPPNKETEVYRAKVGVKYGATPLLVHGHLCHEDLKEILQIAEENGYRICIGSDEPLVIHVEEVKA